MILFAISPLEGYLLIMNFERMSASERSAIEHLRLRVLARCSPPGKAEDFGSLYDPMQYSYDPATNEFWLLWKGSRSYQGSAVVVGTHSNTDVLTWAWLDSEFSESASSHVRAVFDRFPEFSESIQSGLHGCSRHVAEMITGWVALQLGYFGPYVAPRPNQPSLLLVITDLKPESKLVFCVSCFCSGNDVEKMISFADGLGVCNRCVDTFSSIRSEMTSLSSRSESGALQLPCTICGDYGRLIHASHASLCDGCVDIAQGALKKA